MPELACPDPGWIAAQCLASARAMRYACSATHLTRARAGFGWRVRPAAGSVLASPRKGDWSPEPDYFHHWVRDSAITLRAVPLAMAAEPGARRFWLRFIGDYIGFSLRISDPGRRGPKTNPLRAGTQPDHAQFLRPDAELAALTGAAWLEEPRFAADGTPDPERWSRPQDDGPALRASALMAVLEALPKIAPPGAEALIARDLAHTLAVAGRPCIGPWEEAPARRTTFTLLAQWDALERGASRPPAGDARMRAVAQRLAALIGTAGCAATGGWRESLEAPAGRLDSATCLAILMAGRRHGPFALTAPRTLATVAALERDFAGLYPINRARAVPAVGRWPQDGYCGGNPWYPVTLGLAELRYRIAQQTLDAAAFARAEAGMALVAELAPRPPGPLPEQFDRDTGAPVSCLDLTWSAAAFLGAAAARDAALQALAGAR